MTIRYSGLLFWATVAQKSKPLPNYQKIALIRIKPC